MRNSLLNYRLIFMNLSNIRSACRLCSRSTVISTAFVNDVSATAFISAGVSTTVVISAVIRFRSRWSFIVSATGTVITTVVGTIITVISATRRRTTAVISLITTIVSTTGAIAVRTVIRACIRPATSILFKNNSVICCIFFNSCLFIVQTALTTDDFKNLFTVCFYSRRWCVCFISIKELVQFDNICLQSCRYNNTSLNIRELIRCRESCRIVYTVTDQSRQKLQDLSFVIEVVTIGNTSSMILKILPRPADFALLTIIWITRLCLSVRPISRLAV